MKKRKRFGHIFAIASIVCTMTLFLTGCSKAGDLSVSADGTYSFEGDGSDSYRLDFYKTAELGEDGAIPSGTYPKLRYTVSKNKEGGNTYSGTISVVDTASGESHTLIENIGFGEYTPVLVPIKNGKTADPVMGEPIQTSGTLSAPVITASEAETLDKDTGNGTYWGATVSISSEVLDQYEKSEGIYGYEVEVYDNEACSGEPYQAETLEVTGGNSSYEGNAFTFSIPEGTKGNAVTYYVRAKAKGNEELNVSESEWGETVKVEIDGESFGFGPGGPPAK